jgi:hypothetical protein
MKLSNHKGLVFTLSYYLIGLLISYIVYLIFGWEYIHAPGFHHLTFILFLIGGLIWSFIDIIQLFRRKKRFYKESLIVHSIILGVLIIWIIIAFIIVETPKQNINMDDKSSITLINKKDTSLLINELNDTLYLKIKDSIYIDKMNK